MRPYILRCIRCGKIVSPEPSLGVCGHCHTSILKPSLLELEYRGENPLPPQSTERNRGIWAFQEYLPSRGITDQITLGEGFTPLIHAKILGDVFGLNKLWLKNETVNPSGSFKDRISALALSKAKADGAQGVVIVSSGNMGNSVCAYGAAAGIPVTVLVSPAANKLRLSQFQMMGAKVVVTPGGDADKMTTAAEIASSEGLCNVSTPYYPYGLEAVKTVAYEIAAVLKQPPGAIVVPVGYGSLVTGLFRGFRDLVEAKVADKIPRLFAVQSSASPSLVDAVNKGLDEAEPGPADSICSGINQEVTLASKRVIQFIRESGGTAISVSDEEVLEVRKIIAQSAGIIAEPTGAVSVAGVKALIERKLVDPAETVVSVLTGTGLRESFF